MIILADPCAEEDLKAGGAEALPPRVFFVAFFVSVAVSDRSDAFSPES